MCSCHSVLECCVVFSGVRLSMGSFVLFYLYSSGKYRSLFYITENKILFYFPRKTRFRVQCLKEKPDLVFVKIEEKSYSFFR